MIRVQNKKAIANLSRKSLRANRTRNLVAVLAIALTTLLFTALFTIAQTMIYSTQQQTFRQVGGTSHGSFKNLTLEEKEALEQDPMIVEAGGRLMLGMACGENFRKVHAELSYMEESCRKSSFCVPEHGKAPEEDTKEIACDTRILQCLNLQPEIGTELTITYEIGGIAKEKITDTFRLCGWWEFDAAGTASMAILPKSYIETVLREHPMVLKDESNSTGTWTLDIFLDSSLHIADDMVQILKNHGYQTENPYEDNYIDIGVNWGYSGAQMSANSGWETFVGITALAILITLTGYLIIFNIFQISVTGDIRFYGLLKTIGTTKKQIRRIIRRQALLLSAAGIPIGMLFGYFSGRILSPILITSINDSIKRTYHIFNPWIFIGAGAFSLLTVLLSCAKPGKIAARVSPVEAVRYTDTSYNRKRPKKSRQNISAFSMALANLGRNKRKTFLVILSLSLSVILLHATYALASGFDMEKYLEKWIVSDFILGSAAYFQSNFWAAGQPVPETDILAMNEGGKITEHGRVYGRNFGVLEFVTEDLYREFYSGMEPEMLETALAEEERDADGKLPVYAAFYGMEDYPLSQLEVIDGDLSDLYDPEKHAIAAVYLDDDYGEPIESSQWAKVGDTVKARYVYEWEFSDAGTGEIIPEDEIYTYGKELDVKEKEYQDITYEVAACALVKNAMSYRFYGSHQFVLNADVYQRDSKNSDVMIYLFNTEKEDIAAMQNYLTDYTTRTNPILDFESKQRYEDEFDEFRNMYLIVGGSLSFVIGLIGILNFFNAILTSIYARRKEFAMLQAIGMTGRQLKQMLICEGLLYGLLAVTASTVLSFLTKPLLEYSVGGMFWFFTYHFTLRPVLFIIPVFAILGVLLPLANYRNVAKQTIVERLRMEE